MILSKNISGKQLEDKVIYWDKKYCEDTDEEIGYDYKYHDYWFNFPNGSAIRIRSYNDEEEKCCIYGYYQSEESIEKLSNITERSVLDKTSVYEDSNISAIVTFMIQHEKIKILEYYDQKKGYQNIQIHRFKNHEMIFSKKDIINYSSL